MSGGQCFLTFFSIERKLTIALESGLLGGHLQDSAQVLVSNARQTLNLSKLAGVGHNHRGDQRVTRLLDDLGIKLNQSVASSNNIALSNLHAESLTIQVYGIQTNVNQQLNAVLQLQTNSVARGVGRSNLTGCRSEGCIAGIDSNEVNANA